MSTKWQRKRIWISGLKSKVSLPFLPCSHLLLNCGSNQGVAHSRQVLYHCLLGLELLTLPSQFSRMLRCQLCIIKSAFQAVFLHSLPFLILLYLLFFFVLLDQLSRSSSLTLNYLSTQLRMTLNF